MKWMARAICTHLEEEDTEEEVYPWEVELKIDLEVKEELEEIEDLLG